MLDEAAEGESAKASERLELLAGLPLLDLNEQVQALATKLVERGIFLLSPDATHSISLLRAFTAWISSSLGTASTSPTLLSPTASNLAFPGWGFIFPSSCTPEQFTPDDDNDTQDQPLEGN